MAGWLTNLRDSRRLSLSLALYISQNQRLLTCCSPEPMGHVSDMSRTWRLQAVPAARRSPRRPHRRARGGRRSVWASRWRTCSTDRVKRCEARWDSAWAARGGGIARDGGIWGASGQVSAASASAKSRTPAGTWDMSRTCHGRLSERSGEGLGVAGTRLHTDMTCARLAAHFSGKGPRRRRWRRRRSCGRGRLRRGRRPMVTYDGVWAGWHLGGTRRLHASS